jgi:hypothetical protein
MNAKEAKRQSENNGPEARARRIAEWNKQVHAQRAKEEEIEKQKVVTMLQYYHMAQNAILHAIKQGYLSTDTKVMPSKEIAELVAHKLIQEDYKADVLSHTLWEGVDDWRDDYYLRISWE